ncbi:ribosome-associated GTPase EngA [Planctomycetaceae bacterium SCGC AG-212-F19]|nr:ribosome-associated GTPase EngA [Planctomycetaceae bacterium SCGC AG-212-F19]
MPVPVVTIVGRPNVGKSSLFNWLAGRRIAIVDPTAGVTRDRVDTLVMDGDRTFELIDTGGIGIQDVDNLTEEVERQIALAIDRADVVLFLVDARTGLVPLDEEVARRLRAVNKPVISVVNKCDTPSLETAATDFYRLGYGQPIPVSALQNRGKPELLAALRPLLPEPGEAPAPENIAMKLAIVGRRNTGKSTFINQLAQSERMIVSEVPGTTRDSVDVRFERDGQSFIAIDTAGVRRKRSVKGDVEFYSMARAERSIRRADVVLLFFDAKEKVSMVDKKLADTILQEAKPVIFVVNKWDLMKPLPTGDFADYLKATFPMLDFVPMAFVTAKTGRNVYPLVNLAQHLFKQASAHVSTSTINRVLRDAVDQQAPPLRQNRRAKIYYGTQVATIPPTIVLFTNGPELFSNTYQRYLLKAFRDRLPFGDVPIKLYLRARQGGAEGTEPDESAAEAGAKKAPRRGPKRPGRGKKKPGKRSELWKDV